MSSLPGGGKSYQYTVAGDEVTYNIPPAGFNALTASAGELREYNLPARPAAPEAKARWDSQMRNLHLVTPPPYLATTDVRAATNTHWAGNVADSKTYNFSYAMWVEPHIYSSQCSNAAEVTWAGLGGWYTGTLAQDGTIFDPEQGYGQHQAWIEVLPEQTSIVPQNLSATVGQQFTAEVSRVSGGYEMLMENDYTGKSVNPEVSTSSYDGSTAEAITERPYTDSGNRGGFSWLSNFGTFEFTDVTEEYGSTVDTIGDLPHFGVYMRDYSGRDMADPGSIFNGGASFDMTQHLCY